MSEQLIWYSAGGLALNPCTRGIIGENEDIIKLLYYSTITIIFLYYYNIKLSYFYTNILL